MTATVFPFILDGFPRTGSTTLSRILDAHPDINCSVEPFNSRRYGGEFNRLALQHGSVAVALDLIRLRWNGLKHVWEPGTGWPFVENPDLNDDILRHSGIIITLRRRNLLRQFVSDYVSKRLGFWVGTSEEFYARLATAYLPGINLGDAKRFLEEAVDAISRRDQLLSSLPAKQLVLFYEDIFGDGQNLDSQIEFCNSLFAQLGHLPQKDDAFREQCAQYLSPAQYKWANNDIYARIPGSRLLDKELGNDVTGRLFI
jgi:hypothetical protein